MSFKFIAGVDAGLFGSTRGEWESQLAANPGNVSKPYYDASLDFLSRFMSGLVASADGGMGVCGVVEDGNPHASALIVVSHARPNSNKSFLKMLDMYVQPNLNLANAGPNYAQLAWISATAILGCLRMTDHEYPSKQLKIHAQFPLDKEFLTAVQTAMLSDPELSELFDVEMHPNWLVITKK